MNGKGYGYQLSGDMHYFRTPGDDVRHLLALLDRRLDQHPEWEPQALYFAFIEDGWVCYMHTQNRENA